MLQVYGVTGVSFLFTERPSNRESVSQGQTCTDRRCVLLPGITSNGDQTGLWVCSVVYGRRLFVGWLLNVPATC